MSNLNNIEVEIREPTGLGLGTFDLFVVRQKIYEGELQPRCEFKDASGNWVPLAQHKDFADIFWLLGKSTESQTVQKRTKFGGWKTDREDSRARGGSQKVELGRPTKRLTGLRNLTKRFRTEDLPSLPPEDKE